MAAKALFVINLTNLARLALIGCTIFVIFYFIGINRGGMVFLTPAFIAYLVSFENQVTNETKFILFIEKYLLSVILLLLYLYVEISFRLQPLTLIKHVILIVCITFLILLCFFGAYIGKLHGRKVTNKLFK